MTTPLILLGISLLGLAVYLSSLDGKYKVDRSLIINAPITQVYNTVVDFKTWPEWSPWLMHEPETEIVYSDHHQQAGGHYSWDGKLVGAGKLTHQQLIANQSIKQKIEFIRPFKSICSVGWSFKEVNGQTEVHWTMQGSMPFLFRFMTKKTVDMISKDYDLGLNLLNGFVNKDNPHPKITFCGVEKLDDFQYAYRSYKGGLQGMVTAMEQAFPALFEQTENAGITQGSPLTLYHKVDTDKMYFECDMAIPLSQQPDNASIKVKTFSGGRYYKVECQGEYRFLELAWYKAYSHLYMLKLKPDMKRPSLEVYDNNPQEIANSNEIKTSLYVPVK